MNARTAFVDVKNLVVYEDASGAPAVVTVADYSFACDTVGKTVMTCIRPGHGSRTESKIAAQRASNAYQDAVHKATLGTDWMRRNAVMYS